jgi:hypothetical protein
MKNMNYPKIGIRPVIDGRRKGIRESLEETTLGMECFWFGYRRFGLSGVCNLRSHI